MNISIAIISILCFNGSIMHTNEENQGVLQSDRSQGREEVEAHNHIGAATKDAGGKKTRKKNDERVKALVGRTYGRVTILQIVGRNHKGLVLAMCLCECGTQWIVPTSKVTCGRTSSCGCQPKREASPIFHDDGSVSVPLTQGKFARIDGDEFERVSKHNWRFHGGYAVSGSGEQALQLHNFIIPPPDRLFNDHVSRDTLDNRKSNLRICTHRQNCWNRTRPSTNKSGYKGVCWSKKNRKWKASIKADGKVRLLGHFVDKIEAANAYEKAAKKFFGEFARLV